MTKREGSVLGGRMKLEEIKKYVTSKIIVISIGGFILAALLIAVDEIFDIPALVFNAPPTPVNWMEIGIEIFFILMVGAFTVSYMSNLISKLDLERKRAEEELREHREHLEEMVEKRTEELRKSEAKYSIVVENSRDGIVIIRDGVLKFVNAVSLELVGHTPEELFGTDFLKLVAPENREIVIGRYADRIAGREVPSIYEVSLIRKDGTTLPVELNATLINYEDRPADLVFIRDITERRRVEEELKKHREHLEELVGERTKELRDAQEQLVRHEKLAVLGQLAGGVGHELRNPLGAIKQSAYFLNMALEEPEPEVKETLGILEREVATSERIISSLLDFARPQPPIRRKVDVNEVVQEALSRIAVPQNVEVVSQLDESLPAILADPDQLGQVFANIILNAVQAILEGGQLTIKSEVFRPGWVAISFTDTGVGIPPEEQQKVFEPLFTTKAKGIGLGLAVTSTLVEGNGGTIEVQSEVGKGSTFTVSLPIGAKEEK